MGREWRGDVGKETAVKKALFLFVVVSHAALCDGNGFVVISSFQRKVINVARPGTADTYCMIGGYIQQARSAIRRNLVLKSAPSLLVLLRAAVVRGDYIGVWERPGGTVVAVPDLKKEPLSMCLKGWNNETGKMRVADDDISLRRPRTPRSDKPALFIVNPRNDDDRDDGPILPNPWPPDDIVALLLCACYVRLAKPGIDLIKTWLETSKANNIVIDIRKNSIKIDIKGRICQRRLTGLLRECRSPFSSHQDVRAAIVKASGNSCRFPLSP
jgi:hypothetical protein